MSIDPEIVSFYNKSSEENRLKQGLGPLEFERNKDLITRFLPAGKGLVADIGGGPGHYAAWLSDLGHQVVLVEPVEKHVKAAEKRAAKCKHSFRAMLGDAENVPLDNNSMDMVILHGPLYHLQLRERRENAIAEALRVLKPGGVILAFAITHAASTLAALQGGLLYHPEVYAMCAEELSSGRHEAPASFPGMLAKAFFHKPMGLREEFEGFKDTEVLGLYAVEGMLWLDQQFFVSWADSSKRKLMLEMLKATEEDAGLLALSPHMMLAARKKSDA